jgi:hypothetical protein
MISLKRNAIAYCIIVALSVIAAAVDQPLQIKAAALIN